MPALSSHSSVQFVKLLYIGDSGTGKTGSLTSLVRAGYRLRILDLDNGLDILKNLIEHECPDRIGAVDFETRVDPRKATVNGFVVSGTPKAAVETLKLLDRWTDETRPSEWGADTILVIDSLTAFGRAAMEWAEGMNPGAKDPRQWYGAAQEMVEDTIAGLFSDLFRTNVIVISHIAYTEFSDGTKKGYPSSAGSALGPKLAKYTNNLILAESSGMGQNVRRRIRVMPTGIVDVKTASPFRLKEDLPLSTGLATIFETLRGSSPNPG